MNRFFLRIDEDLARRVTGRQQWRVLARLRALISLSGSSPMAASEFYRQLLADEEADADIVLNSLSELIEMGVVVPVLPNAEMASGLRLLLVGVVEELLMAKYGLSA